MLGQAQTTRSSVRSLTPCPPELSMLTMVNFGGKKLAFGGVFSYETVTCLTTLTLTL